jgi:exodeoxyribonuclease VIII
MTTNDPRLLVAGKRVDVARYSNLKHILRGPEHYLHALLTPSEPTPAMQLGTAIHCAVLEPERFSRDYQLGPDFGDMRSSTNRAKRDEYLAQMRAVGVTVLSADDYAACQRCVAAVYGHPLARDLLIAGRVEATMQWTDPETGLPCAGRPDFVVPELKLNIDLKTAHDASPGGFARAAASHLYHMQAAFYLDGHNLRDDEHRGEVNSVLHLVVEPEPPNTVMLYRMDDAAIDRGGQLITVALRRLRECVDRLLAQAPDLPPADAFRDRQLSIFPLALPGWAFYD